MDNNIKIFHTKAEEYDHWFDKHPAIFESEVRAIAQLIPQNKKGIEIGVGTGRFASRLGIKIGIEPSVEMAKLAIRRGIKVVSAKAKSLPFKDGEFDFALFVTVLCFLERPEDALREAIRIIKPGGTIVIATINPDSEAGRAIKASTHKDSFYASANLHSVKEIENMMIQEGLINFSKVQTIFGPPDNITSPQSPREGSQEGGFVVLCGDKILK